DRADGGDGGRDFGVRNAGRWRVPHQSERIAKAGCGGTEGVEKEEFRDCAFHRCDSGEVGAAEYCGHSFLVVIVAHALGPAASRLFSTHGPGIGTSADAARTSACATMVAPY